MASVSMLQMIDDIFDQLTCPICLDKLIDPKILSCYHTFCAACLQAAMSPDSTCKLSCPLCRRDTAMGCDGVYGLPSNFFVNHMLDVFKMKQEDIKRERRDEIKCESCEEKELALNRCVECEKSLCVSCTAEHRRCRTTADHRIIALSEESGFSHDRYMLTLCRYHKRNVIKYYCKTCDEAVCRVCTILEHREHQFVYPKEAIPEQRPVIEELLESVHQQLPILANGLREVENMSRKLRECRETIINEINVNVQVRMEAIMHAKETLIAELDRVHSTKQKILGLQRDGLQLELGKMTGCYQFALNIVQTGNEVELLQIKNRLQTLPNIKVQVDPEEDDTILYIVEGESVQSVMDAMGRLHASQTFASLSYAEGGGLELARVGIKSQFTIFAQDRQGMKVKGGDRVAVEITDPDGKSLATKVLDNDDGSYLVEYVPEVNGKHVISATIQARHVKNSPFIINVINKREYGELGGIIFKFGQYGSRKREFKSPMGLACAQDGLIYVADSYNHRVQIFGSKGETVSIVGSPGGRKGEFNCPSAVAVDSNERIIITDSGNHRVQVFNKYGNCLNKFGSEGLKNGSFKSPWGVALMPRSNEIVVSDMENHRVQIFNSDGTFIAKFGAFGDRKGQFNSPSYVSVNQETEQIFVSDSKNHRIQIFDRRGRFLSCFGSLGSLDGQLNNPRGLAIDTAGNLIVADLGNHRVQIFKPDGQWIITINSDGTADGVVSCPEGVCMMPNGYLVVSDLSNNRLLFY